MSFGAPQPTTQPPTATGGFALPFGAQATASAQQLPQGPQPSTFGVTGGGDAGAKAADKPVAGFTLNKTAQPQAPTNVQPSYSFGTPSNAPLSLTKPPETTATPTPASGLSFGIQPASTVTAAAVAPSQQSFSGGLGHTTTSIASSTITQPSITSTQQKPSTATILSTTTKTTDSGAINQANQINFSELEEHINKWTIELEDQEKIFTNQATQINAWDKLLISNNDKIVALNDAVQKVKTDQQTLEQELEFIATQHAELEESIAPLQKDLHNIPQVDVERTQTYLLVENLDTQLKQMSEDLKEVIDYLNEANKAQDNTDPIVQIGKILNAHMSSLQWIESSSSAITAKLDELSKMHESLRRDSERSFRLTYYD